MELKLGYDSTHLRDYMQILYFWSLFIMIYLYLLSIGSLGILLSTA